MALMDDGFWYDVMIGFSTGLSPRLSADVMVNFPAGFPAPVCLRTHVTVADPFLPIESTDPIRSSVVSLG